MEMLSAEDRTELLGLARQSISARLADAWKSEPPRVSIASVLGEPRSSFVTLLIGEDLRGCCGSLDASRPLYLDVWRNAVAAAFADSRFRALTQAEWPLCELHISVLSAPEPLHITSEAELLATLRPHVDGLILELFHSVRTSSTYVAPGRATFLPSVWEQLPDPQNFIDQLKRKAGWPTDFWSSDIVVSRYQAEEFGENT
jgi:AmmeMemoRadiSam system protein A